MALTGRVDRIEFRRPRHQNPFGEFDDVIEGKSKDRDGDQGGEDQRRIELRRGELDYVAQPLIGAGELPDNGADDAEGDGDFEARHQMRQRMRDAHAQHDLALACADRAHQRHKGRLDGLQPCQHVDGDGEESDDDNEQYLGGEAVAEPNDEDRRKRDLGHVLEQYNDGIERAAEALEANDHERNQDTDNRREHETEQYFERGGLRCHNERATVGGKRGDYGGRRRQYEGRHVKQADDRFPYHDDCRRQRQRRYDTARTTAQAAKESTGGGAVEIRVAHLRPLLWLSISRLRSRFSAAVKAGSE